ncbi:MAG: hypothetical protein HFACDABA_00978 [Anaerolineales bacterium]|nr:hypothetical protein [Anaerolineales bacterium]
MGGAQAQLVSAAQISLWARVQNLQIAYIEKAMAERKLVKASCMRCTLFLVPSNELAVFSVGAASRARREVAWTLRQGVPEKTIRAALDATLSVLDQPLTRKEIAEQVSQKLRIKKRAVRGGGWGRKSEVVAVPVGKLTFPVVDLIHLVTDKGIVCYGPPRGNEPNFVRADAWIPKWKNIEKEEAEDALLRRYLKSFGPATIHDFAMWTGMTLTEARAIWTRQQSKLVSVEIEGKKVFLLQEDLDELTRARLESPRARLLPYFDSFILGHKEREHLLSKQHHTKVYRPQGWVAPVVLVNGRIAGVWEHEQKKNQLRVRVTKFQPFARNIQNDIHEETRDLARFLECANVNVEFNQ